MNPAFLGRLVRPNGTLEDAAVSSRTILYTSPQGKSVERFTVSGEPGGRHYIFKPLTNERLLGRELWAQQHLLPLLPVKHPRLLAASEERDPSTYWIILEDMGELEHKYSREIVVKAAHAIAKWHALPVGLLPAEFTGQKPLLPEVAASLKLHRSVLERLFAGKGTDPAWAGGLHVMAEAVKHLPMGEQAVSHGDLHIGNVALRDGELVVLDWEHLHINSIYWDLYSLLDMSHPAFRRQMAAEMRYDVLRAYTEERQKDGWTGQPDAFIRGYDVYASLYSAWMLLLIERDLEQGNWDRGQLLAQRDGVWDSLLGCLGRLMDGSR